MSIMINCLQVLTHFPMVSCYYQTVAIHTFISCVFLYGTAITPAMMMRLLDTAL